MNLVSPSYTRIEKWDSLVAIVCCYSFNIKVNSLIINILGEKIIYA